MTKSMDVDVRVALVQSCLGNQWWGRSGRVASLHGLSVDHQTNATDGSAENQCGRLLSKCGISKVPCRSSPLC